jgi:hypothetical protein|tara:strand:- start:200 stop:397 length:198 start_codon:yes stop_codon:yes gene_type:complete
MFTALAFIGCLVLIEVAYYVLLLIKREVRMVKEEEEMKKAEAVDSIPPSYLANLEEYEHLVQGEY